MKLTFKLNLLFTGIVSSILLGMALLIFNLSRERVHSDFRQRIRSRAARTAYLYSIFRNDTTNFLKSLDANMPPLLFNKNISIYDTLYHELYEYHDSTVSRVRPPAEWLQQAKTRGEYFIRNGEKQTGVFYSYGRLVMVTAEDATGSAYIQNLRQIFLIYFPLAVLVTLLAGYLFSRTMIRPIQQTIHDVKLITSQNLSHRLFTGKRKDELAQLNETFNALLNRLEESFAMEKRFISNASHELSTPLTAVSSQIEVALLQDRSPAEYKAVLSSVLTDARDLHQLVRNLLEIARAGTQGALSLEKLRVDELLIKAHSDVLAQHPGFRIELDFPDLPEEERACMVFGNPHLLQSAFKNLLENGCKYSPDAKTKAALQFNRGEVVLLFSNKSNFLPTEEMEKLFEPFYRGPNAGNQPGVGLGLTLTRRIIALHKGTLTISSPEPGGLLIRIVLPTLERPRF